MKIRTEKQYIAQTPQGEKNLCIGIHARLIFQDGSYHDGDIEAITEESVIISRGDGNHTYSVREIRNTEV